MILSDNLNIFFCYEKKLKTTKIGHLLDFMRFYFESKNIMICGFDGFDLRTKKQKYL